MTRRGKQLGGGALAMALLIAGVAAAWPRSSGPAVETFRLQPQSFSRRVTAEGNLKAVKATAISAPSDAPGSLKIAWIAEDGAVVRKDDIVVRFDPTDYEKLLLSGNDDRTTASNKLQKASTQAGATRNNLKRDARLAQSELESAKRFRFEDAEIFSKYQRVESEVDQGLASEKKEYAESVLGVREKLAGAERDLLTIEDRKAGLKITKAEQGLRALEVRAPHDGILVLQRDWRGDVPRVGGSAWSGMQLGEIPELQAMKAEVFVLEADGAGLAVDQKATIVLESNPRARFTGKITQIDKLARPRMRGVPVQYFGVTIMLDKTDPVVMKPGARVRGILELESRAGAFVVPRQALFEKQGKKIVYRRNGSKFDPVDVTVGTSSAGRVVITRGLIAGDEIALEDPTAEDESKKDQAAG